MGYEFEKHLFLDPSNLPKDGFAAQVKITGGGLGKDFEAEVLEVLQGAEVSRHITIVVAQWTSCSRYPQVGEVGFVAGTLSESGETAWILEPSFGPAPRLWKKEAPVLGAAVKPSTSNGN